MDEQRREVGRLLGSVNRYNLIRERAAVMLRCGTVALFYFIGNFVSYEIKTLREDAHADAKEEVADATHQRRENLASEILFFRRGQWRKPDIISSEKHAGWKEKRSQHAFLEKKGAR